MDKMQEVYCWLDLHESQMESDLLSLLRINSVRGTPEPNAPFGKGPADALDFCFRLAKKQGMHTDNINGYMGIIDLYGKNEKQIGILSHVDVVPAGVEGWRYPPFNPTISEKMIWGRGVIDDKGPLIACQYALAALKQCNCNLKWSIRHLIGTNEETGMGCIDYYIKHCDSIPVCGFVPDAIFPVVIGEKGLLRWSCSRRWEVENSKSNLKLESLIGGSSVNCVPDNATAVFDVTEDGWKQLEYMKKNLSEDITNDIFLTQDGKKAVVTSTGTSAHAAFPEKGDNAIIKMLCFLNHIDLYPLGAREFIRCTSDLFVDRINGRNLGIYTEDKYGVLTNLLSLINIKLEEGCFSCDTRYPVTADGEKLIAKLQNISNKNCLHFNSWYQMAPLLYSESHPIITNLLSAYRTVTHDFLNPQVIGTGTYARKLPNFIAFGPIFPGQENITHQNNERISIEEFHLLSKIYATAIYLLSNEDKLSFESSF